MKPIIIFVKPNFKYLEPQHQADGQHLLCQRIYCLLYAAESYECFNLQNIPSKRRNWGDQYKIKSQVVMSCIT